MTSTMHTDTVCDDPFGRYRELAFGTPRTLGVCSLANGVPDGPREAWCQGVALGAAGRYAAARCVLEPLTRGEAAHANPVSASLAASTLASHRRQIGGHADGYHADASALRLLAPAAEPDTDGARADALVGLAADAIGSGRLGRCDELLRYVHDNVPLSAWRSRIRYGWVRTEWLLACDRAGDALVVAEETHEYACSAPSGRHAIKSAMQLAVCSSMQKTEGGLLRGARLAEEALRASLDRGIVSLVWPIALLLSGTAESVPSPLADRAIELAREALTSVVSATDAAGRRMVRRSPWMPNALLQAGDFHSSGA